MLKCERERLCGISCTVHCAEEEENPVWPPQNTCARVNNLAWSVKALHPSNWCRHHDFQQTLCREQIATEYHASLHKAYFQLRALCIKTGMMIARKIEWCWRRNLLTNINLLTNSKVLQKLCETCLIYFGVCQLVLVSQDYRHVSCCHTQTSSWM